MSTATTTRVDLRLGNRPYYPELAGLGDAIRNDLKEGIPDRSPFTSAAWARDFGRGVIDHNTVSSLMRLNRMPSIEVLIKLGYLMKQSGAAVEIYDYLLLAADGIWAKIADELEADELPSHTGKAIPHKADLAFSPSYAAKAYQDLPWGDRLAAMQPLLESITRDSKFFAMADDLDRIRELVREAVACRQTIKAFVENAELPYEWVKDILDGRWDEVRAKASVKMVLRLADKVRNLDGKFGDAEFFAPLITKDLQKEYRKEAKKK